MAWPQLALAALALQASPGWDVHLSGVDLPDAAVRSVGVTADGAVWLGLQGEGLARIHDGQVTRVTEANGLVSGGVAGLLEDSAGRLWAVGLGGASVWDGHVWDARAEFDGIAPRVVFSAHEEPSGGAVWLGSNVGALQVAGSRVSAVTADDGLPHAVVHAVFVDSSGVRWFACRRGLARQSGDRIDVFFPETNVRSIVAGPDGTLWFGTSRGVISWDGEAWQWHVEGRTALPTLASADGSIWATVEEGALLRYHGGAWTDVALPTELEGAAVFDAAQATDGSIWVATSVGAARLRP